MCYMFKALFNMITNIEYNLVKIKNDEKVK